MSVIPILQLLVPVFLLILAFFVGRHVEKSHFRRLERAEASLRHILRTNLKSFPAITLSTTNPDKPAATMVAGNVVIASDYLKTFLANLKNFFGGELKSYETLMERARREATLRMIRRAEEMGYNAICNIRMEFSSIGGMSKKGKSAMVEIIVFGTAYNVEYSDNNQLYPTNIPRDNN